VPEVASPSRRRLDLPSLMPASRYVLHEDDNYQAARVDDELQRVWMSANRQSPAALGRHVTSREPGAELQTTM